MSDYNLINYSNLTAYTNTLRSKIYTKSEVDAKILTSTAFYRGIFANWAAVPNGATPSGYLPDPDGGTIPYNNDFIVVSDASDYRGYAEADPQPLSQADLEAGVYYTRSGSSPNYKYTRASTYASGTTYYVNPNVGTWEFRYTGTWSTSQKSGWAPYFQINEEPLTPAQIDALNSGITAVLVDYLTSVQSGTTAVPKATTATYLGTTNMGSATRPIYLGTSGTPTLGNTYAGGTKVTVNGVDKGSATASIYAPTEAGTYGQIVGYDSNTGKAFWATALVNGNRLGSTGTTSFYAPQNIGVTGQLLIADSPMPEWSDGTSIGPTTSSATKPLYLNTSGVLTVGDTYAGGTKVTLNGTTKSGTDANFYAPTSSGSTGQVLQSNDIGSAPSWVNATSGPSGNTIMKRDSNGRAQVSSPTASNDIANKGYVDEAVATIGANSEGIPRVEVLISFSGDDTLYLTASTLNTSAVVNWGDGSATSVFNQAQLTHSYTSGNYVLTLACQGRGDFDQTSGLFEPYEFLLQGIALSPAISILGLKVSGNITFSGSAYTGEYTNLKVLDIKDSKVSHIPANMFKNSDIVELILPGTVEEIHSGAFMNCTHLTYFELKERTNFAPGERTQIIAGESAQEEGDGAFYGCNALEIIKFTDSVTSIGEYAFKYTASGSSPSTRLYYNGDAGTWYSNTSNSYYAMDNNELLDEATKAFLADTPAADSSVLSLFNDWS